MPIKINEMLQLPIFEEFRLVAGNKGLSNYVKLVGIIDHETIDMIPKTFEKNEFVLSTFLNIVEKPNNVYSYVEQLINLSISGLAIKDIYFKELPQNVIDLANENDFPIFIFSKVYYEDIITSVFEANKEKECLEALQLKLNSLEIGELSQSQMIQVAYEINRNFEEKHIVVFSKPKDLSQHYNAKYKYMQHLKSFNTTNSILPYKNGFLIIITTKELKPKDIELVVNKSLSELGINLDDSYIGVSDCNNSLSRLYFSINQSRYACKYAIVKNQSYICFSKLGISKMLFPILNNEWVNEYYNDLIVPLLEFDNRNEGSLLHTAITYVTNKGDIRKTATELYQHSNTIRYRLNKIADLLKEDGHIEDFYQELSIAITLYLLKKVTL